jgi:integrase
MARVGYWKTHRYRRRSIGEDEIPEFIGWDRLLQIIDACNYIDYDLYYRDYCRERDKALIATLFETGGRVGEVLQLRRENFDFSNEKWCVVRGMPLFKRFEKTVSWYETVSRKPTGAHAKLYTPKILDDGRQVWIRRRWDTTIDSPSVQRKRIRKPFPIFKDEPLYPIMESWVKRNHSDLLFPSPKRRKDGTRTMTITNAWLIIHRLQKLTGTEMWPHWFRAQRASQLFTEYGLTWEELKMWFSWQTERMATLYAKASAEDLAERMLLRRKQTQLKHTIVTRNITET